MRRQTPAQRTPPADFSAGGATPPAAPVRGKHVRRVLRFSGWLLVGLCALVLAVGTLAWWWSGRDSSLAALLARAALGLAPKAATPQGQTLKKRRRR